MTIRISAMVLLRVLVMGMILSVSAYSIAFDDTSNDFSLVSHDCQSCHDGVIAPDVRLKHPIDVDYRLAQMKSQGKLKDISQLAPSIALENGRIGCLSCHRPESSIQAKLIMSNAGSALCFSCHNT